MSSTTENYSDEPIQSQKQEILLQDWVSTNPEIILEGCDCISGCVGEFGRTQSNPIPVNGVTGQHAYINRLRTETGQRFLYHLRRRMKGTIEGHMVDHYELVAADGSQWEDLYFDMYFLRRSVRAPDGLILVPWDDLEETERIAVKTACFGVNFRVQDFPVNLPMALYFAEGVDEMSSRANSERVRVMLARQIQAECKDKASLRERWGRALSVRHQALKLAWSRPRQRKIS